MTREKAARYATAVTPSRLRAPSSHVSSPAHTGRPKRWSKSNSIVGPRRLGRHVVLMSLVSVLGCDGIAGATTWNVVLTNATYPAQSQSTTVNAPTGGAATSPKSTSLSLSWVKPVSGATPTGYQVTR